MIERQFPKYKSPPVVEVYLSVQFDRLTALKSAHLGLLWARWRQRFPHVEEREPLQPLSEPLGKPRQPSVRFELVADQNRPPQRFWYLAKDRTELIQIQQDRFIRNWRKVEGSESYPHYDEHIRPAFERDLRDFGEFLAQNELGDIKITQCEVAYLNHEQVEHAALSDLLPSLRMDYSDEFLGLPEDVTATFRYRFGTGDKARGRLWVQVNPVHMKDTGLPAVSLNLTAGGYPQNQSIESALDFMDLGRQWIVKGFTSITSREMHKKWEMRTALTN